MAHGTSRNAKLRDLISAGEILVAPGCYDALSAKIIEKEGFNAVYVSGAGISNTQLGLADVGLTSFAEMRDQIRSICTAVSAPVIADADTGYGNALHVYRTVQEYEQTGLSGLHIEDQQFPKRCGHFDGKQLVPAEEMITKIEAACDARSDDEFVLIARTDARAVEGVDAAIERSNRYADAGADVIFPEAPQSVEEMERFCSEIDAPVMANMVEYGKTPQRPANDLEEFGYNLVIFPNSLLRSAMHSMLGTAGHLKTTGTTADILASIASFEVRNELTDYDWVNKLERRYESVTNN